MKKKLLRYGAAIIITGSALGASTVAMASAQTTAMAQKKGHHHHLIRREAKLNQAVRDGTITTAQETAFKSELKTLRVERKTAVSRTSTDAQRTAERTKQKAELQSWATTNNFPLDKVTPKLAS